MSKEANHLLLYFFSLLIIYFGYKKCFKSVSRKSAKQSEAAAVIFVITQDDIRRSGATTIPDALRMVPGLHVARIDRSTWVVTPREFNGFFPNKLLVLIDGRSVYDPTFSGVHWDVQDTLL